MNKSLSVISIITFVILYIRGVLGCYGEQTLILTIFINILLLFLLFSTRFSSQVFILIALGFLAILHNKDTLALVDLVIFAYIIRKDCISKYVNWCLICAIATTILLIFLVSIGTIQSEELSYNHKGKVIANTMGMVNPNMAAQFFYITFILIYLRVASYSYKTIFIASLIIATFSYLTFEYTQARGVFYATLLLCSSMIFMPLIKKIKKLNKIGLSLLPVIMAAFSFYFSSHLNSFDSINELTTDRVSNVAVVMARMGIMEWIVGVGTPNLGVDSSYMMIFLQGGLITFISLFYFIFKHIWKKYDVIIELEPFIISLLAYGCTENIFSSFNCIAVLFFSFVFFPRAITRAKQKRVINIS